MLKLLRTAAFVTMVLTHKPFRTIGTSRARNEHEGQAVQPAVHVLTLAWLSKQRLVAEIDSSFERHGTDLRSNSY